jgi:hypothetical protein
MRRAVDTWINRPSIDYVVVAVAAVLAWWLDPQNVPQTTSLDAWYQTLASVSGVLLGLGGVAVTVVFAVTPSARLALVYERTGSRLARLVMSCLGALAVVTAGFVALFLVPAGSSEVRNALTAALVTVAVLRFFRLWWLFHKVLTALMLKEPDSVEPNEPDMRWDRPVLRDTDYALPGRRPRRRAQSSTRG